MVRILGSVLRHGEIAEYPELAPAVQCDPKNPENPRFFRQVPRLAGQLVPAGTTENHRFAEEGSHVLACL